MSRKPEYGKQAWVGGLVVGSLMAAAVMLFGDGEGSPEDTPVAPVAVSTSSATRPGAREPAGSWDDSDGARAAPSAGQGFVAPPVMPAALITQVLQEDEKLALFMHYHKPVLLDEQGRNEYRKLLSDPGMMEAMAARLKSPGQGEVEAKEHYDRLMRVDYFEAALAWEGNPQRQKLLEVTEGIILEDNFRGDQDLDRRQMLAGGKLELYRLMYEADASRAMDMAGKSRNTRMEPLVTWMAEAHQQRRAREAQILAELKAQQTRAE